MALRPPTTARVTASRKAPNRPTWGSTPAMPEKAIASGIMAKATTRPDRMSRWGRRHHSLARKSMGINGKGTAQARQHGNRGMGRSRHASRIAAGHPGQGRGAELSRNLSVIPKALRIGDSA